jgi:hypothetical protein
MQKSRKVALATGMLLILVLLIAPLARSTAFSNPDTLSHIAIVSPDLQREGWFGYSISMKGQLLVIGAPGEYSESGRAYVFNSTTGKNLGELISPKSTASGLFGYSVSISGDLVVVGAPGENSNSGDAYLFNATSGALLHNFTDSKLNANFGYSVSISTSLILIGAPNQNLQEGVVYVFNSATGALVRALRSPQAQVGGRFGASVSIDGLHGAVGAPNETSGGVSSAGNAYVFEARDGALIDSIPSPKAVVNGGFGESIAIAGNLIAVGEPGYSSQTGEADIFNASTGAIITTLQSPNAQDGGQFGTSISLAGKTVIVGAPGETFNGFSMAGHAYMFNALTGKLIRTIKPPVGEMGELFGFSVTIVGDKLFAVGAAHASFKYPQQGAAYVFQVL